MALLRQVLLLVLVAGAAAATVTPIEKVISLITDLKNEVSKEGSEEAATYQTFACFCKETTMKKANSVKKNRDTIDDMSADIGDKTQTKKDDSTDVADRKQNQEKLSQDLDAHNAQCAKDKAAYDTELADLNKAVSSLAAAVKAMKKTGGASAASLLAVKRSVSSLGRSETQSLMTALDTVDPDDPEYEYHSNDIVKLCESLHSDFKGERHDLNTEWSKTDKACKETKVSTEGEMTSNKNAMAALDKKIEKTLKSIAEDREDLVQAEGDLKDDELYLKDLTARCEERANDYDQRSAQRAGEIEALGTALGVLSGDVKGRADQVNKRALVQEASMLQEPKLQSMASVKSVSFLQNVLEKHQATAFLARTSDDLSLEAKKNRAVSMLRSEGRRIGSLALSALAGRSSGDPFKKVKGLIQKLIERLLEESAAEATKKGFCDSEIAQAEHDRDRRFGESADLNRELKALEAKEDELTEEIKTLTEDLKDTKLDLKKATEDRDTEKTENIETIKVANEGMEAVSSAIMTLKEFYSSAAKAASLIQASPVTEDAGFAGSYKGKQGPMQSVFALLETIQSDFDRTIRTTETDETKSHRAFVEFSQVSKSSISGKSAKKELDEQDLKSTKTSIEEKMNQLGDTVDLLDTSIKELEELKPQCIDTGMSYKDRVQKRKDEMNALKKALCILDTDKVESMCT